MGFDTLRQKHRQKCLYTFLAIVAFCLAPLQMAYAKDETMPQNLRSWDIEMRMHFLHSFEIVQSVYSQYSEDYEPVVMTLQDFQAVYNVVSGKTMNSNLIDWAEPLIEPMNYNFEVDGNGGIRFDLRYHF